MTTWLEDDRGNKCSVADLQRLALSPFDDCVVWPGYKCKLGYGRIWFAGRYALAHRVAYELTVGPIPSGMVIRHRCDNPSCVNARHLLIGTQTDNINDRASRHRTATGVDNGRSKLSPCDVETIRASRDSTRTLARQFGVSHSRISEIKNHKSWIGANQ